MNYEKPLPPLVALTMSLDNVIQPHQDMVANAVAKINKELPKYFNEGMNTVYFKDISRAALLELVILYRKEGWMVHYGIGIMGSYLTFSIATGG